MPFQIERALPAVAAWGPASLATLLILTLAGVWALGRGRPLWIPARWPARIGSAGLLLLAGMFAAGLYGLSSPMRPMLDQVRSITGTVGHPAGDLAFRQVADDRPRRLSELRDHVVLINLWATWCMPCQKELPAVDRLQKSYGRRGLVVVTLSNEDRALLLRYAATRPLSTLNVYSTQLGWLDVGGRPLSVVIDRVGVVRECMIGARTYPELEAKVTKYLGST